jgi:hypothetical protein
MSHFEKLKIVLAALAIAAVMIGTFVLMGFVAKVMF